MGFDIKNKVAIITGAASGIGLLYTKELLRNGAKGVTIIDVSKAFFDKAVKEINEEFGPNKVIFVQADITNIKQFEEAFQKTVETFRHIDILINNAGIMNDSIWEKEIAININGTVNGVLLGMEIYLPKYKQGTDALIVNIASTAGTDSYPFVPVYCATKHAVLGLTKCWGIIEHYEKTKVRVVAICPGATLTPLVLDLSGRNLGERYQEIYENSKETWPTQEPEFVAKEAMKVIQYAPNGTTWIIEGGEPVYQYELPNRTTMKEKVLKIA